MNRSWKNCDSGSNASTKSKETLVKGQNKSISVKHQRAVRDYNSSPMRQPYSPRNDTVDLSYISSDEDDSFLHHRADKSSANSRVRLNRRRTRFEEKEEGYSLLKIVVSVFYVAVTLSSMHIGFFLRAPTSPLPAPTHPIPSRASRKPMVPIGRRDRSPKPQREVDFLEVGFAWSDSFETANKTKKEFISQDAFSASWWLGKEKFLEVETLENMSPSPEGASFQVFMKVGAKQMRVTRDWMDLGIEHMSKWWKIILDPWEYTPNGGTRKRNDVEGYLNRIIDIFRTYVFSEDRRMFWDDITTDKYQTEWLEVSQSTIAVIAFLNTDRQNGADELMKWSLAATLMSLRQLGVGRIVVSGSEERTETEEATVRAAFKIVAEATKDWDPSRKLVSEMEFCVTADARTGDKDTALNIPIAALKQLRHVFLKQTPASVTECWLGGSFEKRAKKWNYVFLGEPDLLLTTRPSSTAALARELRRGNVLAPHRLQPMPHSADFAEVRPEAEDDGVYMLPRTLPGFDRVEDADHIDTEWSCCDAGNLKPKYDYESCGIFWWQCGYKYERLHLQHEEGRPSPAEAHKIINSYPLVRLTRGTGVVFSGSEIGRKCTPQLGPCTKDTL